MGLETCNREQEMLSEGHQPVLQVVAMEKTGEVCVHVCLTDNREITDQTKFRAVLQAIVALARVIDPAGSDPGEKTGDHGGDC